MFQSLITSLKNNYKNLLILSSLFFISLLAGTFANAFYKNQSNVVAIILWVFDAISILSIFLVSFFLLKFSNHFDEKKIRLWAYFILLIVVFVLYTIIFIILRLIPSFSFLKFVGTPSIVSMIISTIVLGATMYFVRR